MLPRGGQSTSLGSFAYCAAAIDGEACAGDEVVFQQCGDGEGDVFGSAGAAEERAGDGAAAVFFGERFGQQDRAGEDGVDANLRRSSTANMRVSAGMAPFEAKYALKSR